MRLFKVVPAQRRDVLRTMANDGIDAFILTFLVPRIPALGIAADNDAGRFYEGGRKARSIKKKLKV